MNTKAIGDVGEECAVNALKDLGYKILERNVEYAGVEVDVIAKKDGAIVFCEIKTRTNTRFGLPVEAVTKSKQKRYITAAKGYIVAKRLRNTDVRFDVVEVLDGEINVIENAFTS